MFFIKGSAMGLPWLGAASSTTRPRRSGLPPGQVLTHHQGSYRVGHQMDPLSRIHFRRIQVYIGHWPQRIPVSHANPVRPPSSFCYLDRMA